MQIRSRFPALVALIACCLLLSACGNKGSLTLPPKDGAASAATINNDAPRKTPDHNSQPTTPR